MPSDVPLEIETRTQRFWREEERIICAECFAGLRHTLQDAKENAAAYHRLRAGEAVSLLLDTSAVHGKTRECRQFYASEEALRGTIAIAVVVKSNVSRLLGGMVLELVPPRVLTRMFRSVDDGIDWLRSVAGVRSAIAS